MPEPKNSSGQLPALLVSYVYGKRFLKRRPELDYRDWVLDSGAYSAFNSQIEIRLDDYIVFARQQIETDPTLSEVFALDVIGDYRASLRNTETMWKAGVPAIPCYHYGEPEWVLKEIAAQYPKIALGGCARVPVETKVQWSAQVFARVFPKRIHGFGFGGDRYVRELPFHSVDSTSWVIQPGRYGKWRAFGNRKLRSRSVSMLAEIEWYLRLEREAQARWAAVMRQMNTTGPAVRLAVSSTQLKYFVKAA